MLIGHMPAGYMLSKWCHARTLSARVNARPFILAGMLGSVAPDIDMLYFHFLDARRHNHHSYWTHFPIVWISLLAAAAMARASSRNSAATTLAFIFCLNGFVHLLLDSVVGDIRWLAPWSQQAFSLFEVQPRYATWWLNYVVHWFFLVEIAFVISAVVIWRRSRIANKGVA